MFSNKDCKIIEIINEGMPGFSYMHYMSMCSIVGLKYNRYTNISEDYYGNFNLNVDDFENYLLTLV